MGCERVAVDQIAGRGNGDRPADLGCDGDGGVEELGAGQWPGRVVDRHDIDLPGLDVAAEGAQGVPLRAVTGRAARDEQHLTRAEHGDDGVADGGLLARGMDEHDPAYVGSAKRRSQRHAQHGGVAQRQQHLVDLGADPGPGAGGQDDDGSGHGAEPRGTDPSIVFTAVTSRNSVRTRRAYLRPHQKEAAMALPLGTAMGGPLP